MSEAAAEKHDSASAAGGGGSNKLVLILTGVNLIAVVAMVAVLFMSFKRDSQKPSVSDIVAGESKGEHEAKPEGKAEGHEGGEAKSGEHGEAKEGASKKTSDFGKMVTLDQFTVNLSTPGSVNPKFVRVNISLEVPNEEVEGEVTSKMPQVRNTVIDLFNSKRPADLATADGRDYLKEEIRNALNSFLITGKVKGVYFTNFALSS